MVFETVCSWVGRKYPVAPEVVHEILSKIEQEQGEVTRQAFLDASRSENSPTHKLFQWDDEKAAELYRLDQSGRIINALHVEVIMKKGKEPKKVTAFVKVANSETGGKYHNMVYAMSVPDERDFVLSQAYAELKSFKRKYETYSELAAVISAIDETVK